jgi:three-Cys-motif partner protein
MAHVFGGPDTSRKLGCLSAYLRAFTTALRNQNFACVYIDAFAGSGTRTEVRAALPLFENRAEAAEVTSPGSASIAITIDPPLHVIVLFEQEDARFRELEMLREAHPSRQIVLRQGDANLLVRELCTGVQWRKPRGGRRGTRGVIFLDPYGMEVDWSTVQAIAATKALDCWYFFPLSGLYRNAPHDPTKLDRKKEAALDRVLGTTDWRERWYNHSIAPHNLFETADEAVTRADVDAIEAYVGSAWDRFSRGPCCRQCGFDTRTERLWHRSSLPFRTIARPPFA